MEKIGIISGKGGSGKSSLAKHLALNLAQNEKVLLIDSDLGFRTLDLMLDAEDAVYDLYDFSKDVDEELCINEIEGEENLHFICASQSKGIEDIDFENIKRKLDSSEEYSYMIADIPRDEKAIRAWAGTVDRFIVVTEDSPVSLRLTDKIMYIFIKNRINKDTLIVFNKVNSDKNFSLEEKYELFMGPKVKIISKIPFFADIEGEDLEEFRTFVNDIAGVLRGEEPVIREREEKVEEKGFLKKIFGK